MRYNFIRAYDRVLQQFDQHGHFVNVGEWQSFKDNDLPHYKTYELENVTLGFTMPPDMKSLQDIMKPNLPWSEDHFQERIRGLPLNPGEQYKNWPWYDQGVEDHKPRGEFSHTYMERYWAAFAGIRYWSGDLRDVVKLLNDRPYTRQAYLPVWFPEDTGAVHGERVPCSLGYHFMRRGEKLKVVYYMRSCDWFRYFRDDMYLTARLLQWVAERTSTVPGIMIAHISSLHIFAQERDRLKEEAKNASRTV